MKKVVYVAAPWAHKSEAKAVAEDVRKAGHTVVSRWHDTTHNSGIYEAPEEVMVAEAKKDMEDIGAANTLLYLNLEKSEGKATELGIALTRVMKIYVVGGKQNNVFLHLPQINHKDSIQDAIECL